MRVLFKREAHETIKAVFSVTVDTNYEYCNRSANGDDEKFHLFNQGGAISSRIERTAEKIQPLMKTSATLLPGFYPLI